MTDTHKDMNEHHTCIKEKKSVCLWGWEQGLAAQGTEEAFQMRKDAAAAYLDRGLNCTDMYTYQNSPNGMVKNCAFHCT